VSVINPSQKLAKFMKLPALLMISQLVFLLLGGIPAVLTFMNMQGIRWLPILSIFAAHWFLFIYGFFGFLIGNELLTALSVEWSGKIADGKYILSYFLFTASANILALFYSLTLGLLLMVISLFILLIYSSRVYLKVSRIGLKPSIYNYLIITIILLAIGVLVYQYFFAITPYYNLIFPVGTIFAVMSRDIGIITRARVIGWENALALILVILGILLYPNGWPLMILGWGLSLHASKLYTLKGRRYPIVHLITAWIYLLLSSIMQPLNYDAFIHLLSVGFLFNTIFGVDAILLDLYSSVFQKRISIKPTYVPYVLLNLGLITRLAFDLGASNPLLLISAPLQGLGILAFFLNVIRAAVLTEVSRNE